MSFALDLPPVSPDLSNPYLAVEMLLVQVRTQVESRYNQKILVFITTTSQRDANDQPVMLRYTVDLQFVNRNHFQYRLLELACALDKPFAVEVIAPHEERKHIGVATSITKLEQLVKDVFDSPSSRRTILINYML